MAVDRRNFLKIGAAALGTSFLGLKKIKAEENDKYADNLAMLNDSTLCIGCRGCQTACKQSHGLEHTGEDPRYDMPLELNSRNYTVIQMFKKSDHDFTFVKKQCLHCNEPSCVSVCPVAAFTKRKDGVVTYNKDKCIGCRYCEVACPFNVPTFEYDKAVPQIRKCDFCKDNRLAKGEEPVCASVCPRGAIKFGKRGDLIKEAYNRIKNNPDKYNQHIYGETEIAGTSVLYLAPKDVSFEELGYYPWDNKRPGDLPESIQHGIFQYGIAPVALYGLLGVAAWKLGKSDKAEKEKEANHES